jgi:hypothetical protein
MTETPDVDPRSAGADEQRSDVEGAMKRHAADGPADDDAGRDAAAAPRDPGESSVEGDREPDRPV